MVKVVALFYAATFFCMLKGYQIEARIAIDFHLEIRRTKGLFLIVFV